MKSSQDNDKKRPPFSLPGGKGGVTAILAVLALLSVVIMAAALTGAWQVFGRIAQRGETAIVSDDTQLAVTECNLYYGELTTGSDGKISATGAVISSPDKVSMNGYDAVVGRNEDTAVYMRLTIAGQKVSDKGDITVTLNRENTGDLKNATDDEGLRYTKTDADKHWTQGNIALNLSNVVAAQAVQIPSLETETDADTVYKGCKGLTWSGEGAPELKSFFSAIPEAHGRYTELGDATKSNSLTFNFSGYDTTTYDNGITTAVFFIKFDYSQALVEVYLNSNYQSLSGRLNQRVTENFNADITSVTVE